MSKRHAIFTAANGHRPSFLLNHWLVSLQENVNLADIDVNVLDYGLTRETRRSLEARGVLCHRCVNDGQVGDIRIRDTAAIAAAGGYDQVLSVDSGDLIFQADISGLFKRDTSHFRAVCEELRVPIHHVFIRLDDFQPDVARHILDYLYDKPVINGGWVLGPVDKFRRLWDWFQRLTIDHQCYCTDQMVLNYVLHREGFRALPSRFNFVLVSMTSPFFIRRGVFYDAAGERIPVVHNAGVKNFTRKIADFGYGPQCNRRRWLAPIVTRGLIHGGNVWKWLTRRPKRLNRHAGPIELIGPEPNDIRRPLPDVASVSVPPPLVFPPFEPGRVEVSR